MCTLGKVGEVVSSAWDGWSDGLGGKGSTGKAF